MTFYLTSYRGDLVKLVLHWYQLYNMLTYVSFNRGGLVKLLATIIIYIILTWL